MTEPMDYAAFNQKGECYAICEAGIPAVEKQFRRENDGATIKLLPRREAVELHLAYVATLTGFRMQDAKTLFGKDATS